MQFNGGNAGRRIVVGKGKSFAARSRTAIQDICSMADEGSDELRGFVLDHDLAGEESLSFCDLPGLDVPRGS
jgi:hypothetical protein